MVEADGEARIVHDQPAKHPPIDCFYIYPTASTQTTPNASLSVDSGVLAAAQLQAERFSQVCRVYAPVYRQLTVAGLTQTGVIGTKPPAGTPPANFSEPYADVSAAWTDYLAHYNHGRGVVLIGHSQGSFQLIQLVRQRIETDPSVLRRIVSAILPGGNVQVSSTGPASSSTFDRLTPCRSVKQTHCVVAYSSFPSMPPPGATFGRTNGPTSGGAPGATSLNASVVCTNPAALSGGSATFSTYFPATQNLLVGGSDQPKITTAWVEYPNLFRGKCLKNNSASWLQVDAIAKPGDHRPHPIEALGPGWGYHLDDINLPLGNLVHIVCQQSSAYVHKKLTCPAP
ncbi:MAG: alpha/beta fold hydrolase [Acidimicrobiales bacterium]